MQRKLSRAFHRVAARATRTPVSRLPGAGAAYRFVQDLVAPTTPDEQVWISYRGYELSIDPSISDVGRILYRTGEHEPFVREVVDQLVESGDTVVDVGGHFGHHVLSARENVGEEGRVLVFEPHPALAEHLRRTRERNGFENVEVIEAAVSSEAGASVLHEVDGPAANAAKSRLDPASGPADEPFRHGVESVRLSDALADRGVEVVDLMKMDVEGHEASAIASLGDAIENVRALLVEVHDLPQAELESLDERLTVYPVRTDVHDGHRIDSLVGEAIDDGHVHLLCRQD